jgi:cytochrome P450
MSIAPPSAAVKNTPQLPVVNSPAWWQTLRALLDHLDYLEETRTRYGENFAGTSVGFSNYVIFSNPKAIEQLFTAHPSCFDSGVGNQSIQPLLGDYSLVLLDGKSHQQQRKLLMPPFHGERMRAYSQAMYEITQRVLQKWQPNQPFEMRGATQEITLRVILNTVFGLEQGERFEQLRILLSEWLDTFNSPLKASFLFFPKLQQDFGSWSPWGRFVRLRDQIDQLLYAEIRDRKTQPLGEDILSLMMAARDEKGEAMSEQELRDELMTLLFAGHETTASALAWAFYWVHYHPEVLDKLLEELQQCDLENDPSAVLKLPYLNAVCSETLRIYPIVIFAFVRQLKVPMQILDYQFEPGTQLIPCIYLVHHREDIYPNSKQFRPERFLERQFSPYEFFPFGGGNRRCLGYAFALLEMKLVLATVLTHTKLELIENRPIKPVRRGLTFSPENGVLIKVKA